MKSARNKYIDYLRERLKKQKGFTFEGELAVRKAITSFEARGKFLLLHLYQYDMYLYYCETDENGDKFRIIEYQIFNHLLNAIDETLSAIDIHKKYSHAFYNQNNKYIYDDYYNKLCPQLEEYNRCIEKALSNLPTNNDIALFIEGFYCNNKAVIYALQHKAKSVVSMALESSKIQKNPQMLKCLFPIDVMKSQIQTDPPISLLGCISKPLQVFVPLNEISLEATFWDNIKWCDIIPSQNKDCCIADIECKYLTLKIEVDGFQNIFCRITDSNHQVKYVLIYNSQFHNYKFEENDNKENGDTIQRNSSRKRYGLQTKTGNTFNKLNTGIQHYTHFLVDTNALIHNPDLIPSIIADKSKQLIMPLMIGREVNKLKDKNYNVKKEAQINYDNIYIKYKEHIIFESVEQEDLDELPMETKFSLTPDDLILAIAIRYKLNNKNICLVTDDAGFRQLCESLEPNKQPGLLYSNQFQSTSKE